MRSILRLSPSSNSLRLPKNKLHQLPDSAKRKSSSLFWRPSAISLVTHRRFIELDADLEADLGIDTVKQAQVLGKVRDRFHLRTDEKLSLRDFPTLRHILDYVHRQLQEDEAKGPRRSVVPMVDVTIRRSNRPIQRFERSRIEIPSPSVLTPSGVGVPSEVKLLHLVRNRSRDWAATRRSPPRSDFGSFGALLRFCR